MPGFALGPALGRVALAAVCALSMVAGASAATLPPGFTETQVAGGFGAPTAMALARDGRLFVAEQTGALRVIKNGSLLATPFVSLDVDPNGERGLLGIAFDPAFERNQFVYLYYTVPGSPAHNRISRFTAAGDVASAGSEQPIFDLDNLGGATNHNGGAIHFGPDGKLYVAVGDAANSSNAPLLTTVFGKMLRINSDGSIPVDNPFYEATTGQYRAIWARGLRNPFTFSFKPGTGRMFINDVGQNTWEEIDDGVAGSDYGWPATEGPTSDPRYRSPVFAYRHDGVTAESGCAITGGAFYPQSAQFPAEYVGDYLFADFCNGWIRRLDLTGDTPTATGFATGIANPVDLAVAADGSLYYLARGSNAVFRVQFSTPTAVRLHAFTARRTLAGTLLTWRAATAGRTMLGFHVYREQAGKRVRLSRTLLAASNASFGRHAFVDRNAPAQVRARYWLALLLADGSRSWHGPVAASG